MTHPDLMREVGPATPADVEKWWSDALAGRRSWGEVSAWVEDRLTDGADTEIVLEGLLQLQSADSRRLPLNELADAMSANLAVWRRRLVSDDADPSGFERAHLRQILASYGQWRGVEAAQRFGQKLVAQGLLTDSDLQVAIRSGGPVDCET